jgi:hypothetical protein
MEVCLEATTLQRSIHRQVNYLYSGQYTENCCRPWLRNQILFERYQIRTPTKISWRHKAGKQPDKSRLPINGLIICFHRAVE